MPIFERIVGAIVVIGLRIVIFPKKIFRNQLNSINTDDVTITPISGVIFAGITRVTLGILIMIGVVSFGI